LLLPCLYLLVKYYREQKKIDWPLLIVNAVFLLMLVWMFVPHLGLLGKVTLLERVPHARLLVGMGLLNMLQLVLFIRRYVAFKDLGLRSNWFSFYYAVAIFFVELWLGDIALHRSIDFITPHRIFAFAIPVPVVVYFVLRKRFVWRERCWRPFC